MAQSEDPLEAHGMSEAELVHIAHAWDKAMLDNDADAIGEFMTDEWTIIGPDGSVNGKKHLLTLIRSGELKHDAMSSDELSVRVYGATAIVIARGISGGTFKGMPFREHERASNVFIRERDRWRCVMTHISTLPAS